jgi:hypothetical protein
LTTIGWHLGTDGRYQRRRNSAEPAISSSDLGDAPSPGLAVPGSDRIRECFQPSMRVLFLTLAAMNCGRVTSYADHPSRGLSDAQRRRCGVPLASYEELDDGLVGVRGGGGHRCGFCQPVKGP